MKQEVILVDTNDNELGVMEKLQAHKKGLLHRAISVFVFNKSGKLLLQQRNSEKYHSGGLWTNTACSHPTPGEMVKDAAIRRLKEEMGIECPLTHAFHFTYKARLDKELFEHELDHVFIGYTDKDPMPDNNEVMDWKWASKEEIKYLLLENPKQFTEWFKICYEKAFRASQNEKNS